MRLRARHRLAALLMLASVDLLPLYRASAPRLRLPRFYDRAGATSSSHAAFYKAFFERAATITQLEPGYGASPIVWTPDKRMKLQAAAAASSPETSNQSSAKRPGTLIDHGRRDVDFEGLGAASCACSRRRSTR